MNKSIPYYSILYAGYFLIAAVMILVIGYLVVWLLPNAADAILDGAGGFGMSAVGVILPPLLVGQMFYTHEKRRMKAGEGWLMASIFAILSIVLSVVSLWIITIVQPMSPQEAEIMNNLLADTGFLLTVLGILAVFMLLANKVMLWSGVRGAIKTEEKLAMKAGRKG